MANGTIYQLEKEKTRGKCRKWKVQVSAGKDLATGKYRKICRNVHGTYSDAQKALRELTQEVEAGAVERKKGSITFEAYAEKWLVQRKQTRTHGTWRKNVDHIKCANLHIAKAKLSEITPSVIETMYAELQNGKSPSGKKLSGTYTECIARTLNKLFKDAIEDGLIAENPCTKAEKPKNDTPERKSLKTAEIYELVEKLDPQRPTQLVALLAIKAGICRGEAHGLTWGDIGEDFIFIHQNQDDGGNMKPTKTKKRTRKIPLTPSIKTDLEAAKSHTLALFARYNRGIMKALDECQRAPLEGELLELTDDTPVICDGYGNPINPHASSQWWNRHRKEIGFDGYVIHELRHSYLSELARRKVPIKTLQEIAGHEKGTTTMDIYLHANDDDKLQAVQLVDW